MTWDLRRQGSRIWIAALAVVTLVITCRSFAGNAEQASMDKTPGSSSASKRDQTAPLDQPDLIFVQATKLNGQSAFTRFPEGSRIVRLSGKSSASQPKNLTPEMFAAADPQISFDGDRVAFAAQTSSTSLWQIWEMGTDGSNKRQISNCTANCVRPAYFPDDEIAFTAQAEGTDLKSNYLAAIKRDGSEQRRITFGPGNWWLETVLRDGRILASANSPLTDASVENRARSFYTMRPEGTALDSLRCQHTEIAARSGASELEDGSIIYVKSASANKYGGALTEIRQGDLNEAVLGPGNEAVSSPHTLSPDRLIVSRKMSIASKPDATFELFAFDLKRKAYAQKIYGDAKLNSVQPVPIVKQSIPKKYWSMVNPESKSGYLIALDAYASVDEKNGRFSQVIANVRVWTLQPSTQKELILGEAPVEKDGSFYVEVPADQPVRFELLGPDGQTIRKEQGWIWSRAGEQRGCAGCHSDKAIAPENRWPMTLKRFDTPTQFGQSQSVSAGSHANQ